MIDSHIHLEQYQPEEIDRLIEEWQREGIKGVVAVSTNLASSYRTLALKQKYPEFVLAAVGYHPEQPVPPEQEMVELLELIKKEREMISAIGEVGLPHYAKHTPVGPYKELLAVFAEAAKRFQLPVILHAVHDKAEVALDILFKHAVKKAHFHWLKAPDSVVQKLVSANYYISVTPEVCYRERDQKLAEQVPLPQLLLETDGPWPFLGPFTGKKTTPLLLKKTAQTVAKIKKISPGKLSKQCTDNVLSLFVRKFT